MMALSPCRSETLHLPLHAFHPCPVPVYHQQNVNNWRHSPGLWSPPHCIHGAPVLGTGGWHLWDAHGGWAFYQFISCVSYFSLLLCLSSSLFLWLVSLSLSPCPPHILTVHPLPCLPSFLPLDWLPLLPTTFMSCLKTQHSLRTYVNSCSLLKNQSNL